MATLAAGVQYALSSQRSATESKDLVFVKLTDSAFRAVEEYLRMKDATTEKPTIEFVGDQGSIKFPMKNPAQGHFNFTLSEGLQGGFDCVWQNGKDQIKNLGALPRKMQIKANDDVYETTRSRMQQVEVDNKNKCTRVLKANDSVNKKVRVKKDEQKPVASSSKHDNRANVAFSFAGKQSNTCVPSKVEVKKDEKGKAFNVSNSKLNTTETLKKFVIPKRNNKVIPKNDDKVIPKKNDKVIPMKDDKLIPKEDDKIILKEDDKVTQKKVDKVTKELRTSSSKTGSKTDVKSNGKNDVPNKSNGVKFRSLVERISQLLAIRSYTKFELKTRFNREGVLEKEKNQLTSNLLTVAYPKGNKYHLKKHWYSNVKEDWPFYTEQEKLQVRVNKATNLAADSSDGSCSGLTPKSACSASPSSNVATSPIQLGSKRKANEQEIVGYPTKKQRVSNHVKSDSTYSSEARKKSLTNPGSGQRNSKQVGEQQRQRYQSKSKSSSKEDIADSQGSSPESIATESSTAITESSPDLNHLDDLGSTCETSFDLDSQVLPDVNTDYLMQYEKITSYEQRRQYKTEYYGYWPEYQKLHIERVHNSRKFSDLQDRLRKEQLTGTAESINRIIIEIRHEYIKTKDVTVKFNNLHKKLEYIKKLISDFDDRLNADLCFNYRCT